MKKLFFVLVAMVAFSFASFADGGSYTLNDNAIDALFAQADEVAAADIQCGAQQGLSLLGGLQDYKLDEISASANPWAAFAICTVIGGFGIHRHYLGTGKPMWLYYTCTFGGIFGIVTFVDWVMLLVGAIQDDISAYTNNDDFFMWL